MVSSTLITQAHSLYIALRIAPRYGNDTDKRLDRLTYRAWRRYTRRNPNYRKLVNHG